MTEVTATLPPQIQKGAERLISEGWFKDENELLEEALRRFLESHPVDLMEKFVKEDIEWGLKGND